MIIYLKRSTVIHDTEIQKMNTSSEEFITVLNTILSSVFQTAITDADFRWQINTAVNTWNVHILMPNDVLDVSSGVFSAVNELKTQHNLYYYRMFLHFLCDASFNYYETEN